MYCLLLKFDVFIDLVDVLLREDLGLSIILVMHMTRGKCWLIEVNDPEDGICLCHE